MTEHTLDQLHATNISRGDAYERSITKLAELMADDETGTGVDHIEWLNALQAHLAPLAFQHLCDMLEVCEVHIVDYRICADDEADCPTGAEAKRLAQEQRYLHSERDSRGWH